MNTSVMVLNSPVIQAFCFPLWTQQNFNVQQFTPQCQNVGRSVVKFSRNGVPQPVSGVPPPEIAVPPPKVVDPPPGDAVLYFW